MNILFYVTGEIVIEHMAERKLGQRPSQVNGYTRDVNNIQSTRSNICGYEDPGSAILHVRNRLLTVTLLPANQSTKGQQRSIEVN